MGGMGGMPGGGMHGGGMRGMWGPMWHPSLPPDLARLLAIHPQPIPLLPVLGLLGLVGYLLGVRNLHRRGIAWPVGRTIAWCAGVVVLEAVTATGVEGYGMMLMSVHMAQHMVLAMIVPILLLLGAPVTLTLRALKTTGRSGTVRRAVVRTIASRPFAVLTSIPVRWFLFLFGMYGIYFTPIFDDLMSSVYGHNLMMLHFLASGLLFFGPLVAVDPWPRRATPPLRLLETFASTPFHAFFGIAVMMATHPLVSFFTDPPRSWHVNVLDDQNLAGGIAWATSEVPTLIVMGVILVQWIRSDQREARREERTIEADLAAYNGYLASLRAGPRRVE